MAEASEPIGDIPPGFAGPMMDRLGVEWIELSADRLIARIPVEGNTQPYGVLHGGATAALCETVGSVGAQLRAAPGARVLGIELNVNHLQAVRQGHITATGRPLHQGRSTAVWNMEVTDDEGRLVAVGRLTLAVRQG